MTVIEPMNHLFVESIVMRLPDLRILAAIFEVMDKAPSLFDIWSLALGIGVGGFLLCRFRHWFLAAVLPVALLFSVGLLQELHDPSVGKYILTEAGRGYYLQSYLAMLVQILLPCLGLIDRRKTMP